MILHMLKSQLGSMARIHSLPLTRPQKNGENVPASMLVGSVTFFSFSGLNVHVSIGHPKNACLQGRNR